MPVPTHPTHQHAVVIGGSMAGLLAARVLADHFAEVTLVERDVLSAVGDGPRKGVPQGRHLHALLARGQQVCERLFPGLTAELEAGGALSNDPGLGGIWYQAGGYKAHVATGVRSLSMSRPYLEGAVRRRLLALPNVTCREGLDVRGLAADDGGALVAGVQVQGRTPGGVTETLYADLVVDASGRGSAAPRWLEELGYGRPRESVIRNDIGYASRIYRRPHNDPVGDKVLLISPTPPDGRAGVMFPIEGDRWIVTLAGRGDDHPPIHEAAFLAYARSLAAPDIYQTLLRAEPLGAITPHKFPSNLRRRYEQMARLPGNFVVLGDAVCSFNPIYGQGMTSAALQALALHEALAALPGRLDALPADYFRRAAQVVEEPWRMAAGGDFAYPATMGEKARGTDLINGYMALMMRGMNEDPELHAAFIRVMHMLAPSATLFAPKVVARVLRHALRRRPASYSAPAPAYADQAQF